MSLLQKISGIQAAPAEIVKFLILNTGGKFAAIIVVLLGTVYFVAPELPEHYSAMAGRAQWMLISYLIGIIYWRGLRNQQMIVTELAKRSIDDPSNASNTSPDPAIQREITKQLSTKQ